MCLINKIFPSFLAVFFITLPDNQCCFRLLFRHSSCRPACLRFMDGRKEGNVLFNGALNTFYLRLYHVRHMIKDHSDSKRGNPLPPHGLLFPISSNGSFIGIILQTRIAHTTVFFSFFLFFNEFIIPRNMAVPGLRRSGIIVLQTSY